MTFRYSYSWYKAENICPKFLFFNSFFISHLPNMARKNNNKTKQNPTLILTHGLQGFFLNGIGWYTHSYYIFKCFFILIVGDFDQWVNGVSWSNSNVGLEAYWGNTTQYNYFVLWKYLGIKQYRIVHFGSINFYFYYYLLRIYFIQCMILKRALHIKVCTFSH